MTKNLAEQLDHADAGDFSLKKIETGDISTAQLREELVLSEHEADVLNDLDYIKQWLIRLHDELESIDEFISRQELPLVGSVRSNLSELQTATSELSAGVLARMFDGFLRLARMNFNLRAKLKHETEQLIRANRRYNKAMQTVEDMGSSFSFRIGQVLLAPARGVRSIARQLSGPNELNDELKDEEEEWKEPLVREVTEEHDFYRVDNPYANVSNKGTALDIFKNWVTLFHFRGHKFGANEPLVSDWLDAINRLNKFFPLQGKSVLELGPLEGANTKQMLDLGASQVVAIESNKEAFLKCLIVKNEFGLNFAHFVFGDCNEVLAGPALHGKSFDFCLCSGLLYHMEDPLLTIELISQLAPAVYVWSHVASVETPKGEWVTIEDKKGNSYSGRRNVYKASDALGGIGCGSLWLTPDSLIAAFKNQGYAVSQVEDFRNYKGHGLQFLARRSPPAG